MYMLVGNEIMRLKGNEYKRIVIVDDYAFRKESNEEIFTMSLRKDPCT